MRSCCILYLLKCDGGATMEIKCMCVLLCGAMTLLVSGQFVPPSPCPEIFNYQNNGQEIYGTIRYQPSGRATTVVLRANFTVKATLPSRYVGQLEVLGAKQQVLQSILRGQPLEYRVHFPVTSPVPRLSVITVNGNVLCFGPPEIAGPGEAVTSVSLDHMLYANDDNGNPSLNLDPAYNTVPNKNPMIYLDNDNTFMINPDTLNLDNNEPSFVINTITIPNRHSAQNVPQQYPQQIYPQQQTTLPPQQYFPQQQPSNAPPVQFQARPVQTPQMAPNPTSVECGIPSGGNERVPLVFHGSAVSRGDWPWVVAVYVRRENALLFICSGSLISNQHILTAAHCMHQKTSLTAMRDIVVKVGVYNLDDWSDDNAVTRSLSAANIHPNYNSNTLENDILLMTLDKTVTYTNYIRPVCLWEGGISLSAIVGQTASVIGWGTSEVSPSGHGEPRLASLPIVSTETCRASRAEFHKLTSDKTICAGDRNGAGPCNGDSGGGLYMLVGGRWLLRGVVSLSLRPVTGDNTCNLNEYVVFTDAAQYLPWVRQYFGVG